MVDQLSPHPKANLALALRLQAERTGYCTLITAAHTATDGAIEEFAARNASLYLDNARRIKESILAAARDLGCP